MSLNVVPQPGYVADTVLMVPPRDFCFNHQTSSDNVFQHQPQMDDASLKRQSMAEYRGMVVNLREAGIDVIEFDNHVPGQVLPDAVFPNNWLATTSMGDVYLFPMHTANRRAEVRPQFLHECLQGHQRHIRQVNYVAGPQERRALEGTGAMVIDHQHGHIYAARSERCTPDLVEIFADITRQSVTVFDTQDSNGKPVYHTNVLMSVGIDVAVICSSAIKEPAMRHELLKRLKDTHAVIELTFEQMEQHFCGNILQVCNHVGEPVWIMSESAWEGFTSAQQHLLKGSGKICASAIPTIEKVGGGSCRCMVAEVFLPRSKGTHRRLD